MSIPSLLFTWSLFFDGGVLVEANNSQNVSIATENPFYPIEAIYINEQLVKNINETQTLITTYLKESKTYFDIEMDDLRTAYQNMEALKTVPSAFWIDKKERIADVQRMLDTMVQTGQYSTIVLIVYDLPNRDCAALASNGELCCNESPECATTCTQSCQMESTDCQTGIEKYKTQYIDELYRVLSLYDTIHTILIMEPDSLPNIPTNRGAYGCSDVTTDTYMEGIAYAIDTLSKLPRTTIYLDIGHEGWLGWCNNLFDKEYSFVSYVLKTLSEQIPKIRGFATNVANYQNIGTACKYPFQPVREIVDFCSYYNQYLVGYCKNNQNGGGEEDDCCYDPCGLLEAYNPANNELNYIQLFRHALEYAIDQELLPSFRTESGLPHFIVDTSRNGVPNAYLTVLGKSQCSTWCNVRGGHIGILPTTDTPLDYIDAYFWLKTPGESDGCVDSDAQGKCSLASACSRYDANCGTHPDNIGYLDTEPCPPEAGSWFDYQFIRLNL